ncbi:hypothetical protein [Novosphingobium sp.]|uniref:hypothetical protein n=1 Tax=Novosphingobium sp. TaxID=1874826 RepID=UPI00286E9061|nr:hypothetical protein [Novosphingobium sp.]
MGDYLKLASGVPTDANANATSAGAGDAGKIVKLDGSGKIDSTMMPIGVGAETRSMTTSEAVAAGDLVNIHNSTGPKVRKADATTAGKESHGFVLSSAGSGASVTVYPEQAVISGLTGLTPGTRMFLATTAGTSTATAPSTSGQVVQDIGYAISTTEILFNPRQPITLA